MDNKVLTITGSHPAMMQEVFDELSLVIPAHCRPFSDFTFTDNQAPPVIAYVMSDLNNKHIFNLADLKRRGCHHLIVLAAHLTVPAMCELLRTHVDDVVVLPILARETERLQDSLLPILDSKRAFDKPRDFEGDELSIQCAINFEEIIELIEEHFCAKLSLAKVSDALSLSPSRVSHLFKDVCGIGFRHYLTCRRLEEAETLLADPRANITSVAFGLGFSSPSHFCKAFKDMFGITPTAYLAGNRQFALDDRFRRYQHLRLTILPYVRRLANQTIPAERVQLRAAI
ncbi:helix-turn-helix transcriptional regulator [Salinimonas lutimaris]|uniref:helix-turn-helix transcriptional regulator n=1 Tax=Salinimonas lutimaris TaxID=914153 RepID=UPI001585D9BC|nr:AraC family transcriptional regulator [Salinimonas lutimaris]